MTTDVDVRDVAKRLADGAVALVPTETVYGLAVHPDRDDAITRLFAMKARPRSRNLAVMVSDVDDVAALGVDLTPAARALFEAFSPGALTVALGVRPDAAPAWLRDRDEVAVRIPDHDLLRAILRVAGPLFVTSANRHAESTPADVDAILAQLTARPDVVIDGGVRPGTPSTLVNCNRPDPVIERSGDIPDSEILRVLHG